MEGDKAAVNGHGDGGEVEVVEQHRQVVMQTLRRHEVQLQRSMFAKSNNQPLPLSCVHTTVYVHAPVLQSSRDYRGGGLMSFFFRLAPV